MSVADRTPPVEFFGEPEHQPFSIGGGETGVLLVHGFMGTPAEMRPLGERLAAAGYNAAGLLLPGFGPDIINLQSTNRQQWLSAAAEAWEQLRRDHDRTVLIGYSMGGAVAIELAAEIAPDALVLFAPFWRLDSWMARLLPVAKHVVRSVAPFEKANFDDPAVRAQLQGLAPGIDLSDPDTQRFLREEVRLPLTVLDEVAQLGRSAHRTAQRITAPALVIQGESDPTVTPKATLSLVNRLGGPTEYLELPGGHDLVRLSCSAAGEASSAVLRFLAETVPTGIAPELSR